MGWLGSPCKGKWCPRDLLELCPEYQYKEEGLGSPDFPECPEDLLEGEGLGRVCPEDLLEEEGLGRVLCPEYQHKEEEGLG